MKTLFFQLLVFAIPATLAAIAHMFVVKSNFLPALTYPLDFNLTYRNKRIFGNNKTFRGLVAMAFLSVPAAYLLYWLTQHVPSVSKYNIIQFEQYHWALIGLIIGLAYVVAELPNSFVKRQQQITEGSRGNLLNIMVDQVDSPIGCMLALLPFAHITSQFFVAGIAFYLLLHMSINFLLYILKVRKNPI